MRQAFLEKNEMQAFAYMGAAAAAAASLVFTVKGVSISLSAIMASGLVQVSPEPSSWLYGPFWF